MRFSLTHVLVIGLASVLCGCADPGPTDPEATARYPRDYRAAEATSLLGRPLYATPPSENLQAMEAALATAQSALVGDPSNPEKIVWVGRRLGYLWRMTEAIDVFTRGIESHGKYAPLFRHRGHRYITIRRFDKAAQDLETASRLIYRQPDEVEQDGMPNSQNLPLTTTGFNVWYHLGIARYLQGDFQRAKGAFEQTMNHLGGHDDNLVAVTDWLYMTLRRLSLDAEADQLLEPISHDMRIIENMPYHQRLLMYKGMLTPEELLNQAGRSDLDMATLGYGVGNWYLYNGNRAKAVEIYEKIVAGPYWPAFGYIAAEVDLSRLRRR